MKRFCLKQSILLYINVFLFSILCLFSLTRIGLSDLLQEFVALFVVLIGTATIFYYVNRQVSDIQVRFFVLAGYLLRVSVMLVNIILPNKKIVPLAGGGDAEDFWCNANLIYRGENPWHLTRFASYLGKALHLFGSNRVVAQYLNVLAWFVTVVILLSIANKLALSGKQTQFVIFVMAFTPINICLSSILLRESIMIMLDTLSLVLFIFWMRNGAKRYLFGGFIVAIPAILLHNSSIALWVGYALILLFWDTRRQRFRMRFASIGVLLGIVVVSGLVYYVPILHSSLVSKFGLNNLSLYGITHRYQVYKEGDSTYLYGMDCQNWGQFIIYTVIRMIYFLFSPMPWDWRGLQDIVTFVLDSVPIFILLMLCLKVTDRTNRPYVFAGLLSYIMMVGIFAWGTMTAGTAIRHRGQLIGILLLTYCFARARTKEEVLVEKEEISG